MNIAYHAFHIHMAVQMLDFMAEGPCQKLVGFHFVFGHVFVKRTYNDMVRALYFPGLARKAQAGLIPGLLAFFCDNLRID